MRTPCSDASQQLAKRHTKLSMIRRKPCIELWSLYDAKFTHYVRLTRRLPADDYWANTAVARRPPMYSTFRLPPPISLSQRIRRAATPRQSEEIAADMIVSLRQRAARHNLDLAEVMRDALIGLAAELSDSPEELGSLVSMVAEEARAE